MTINILPAMDKLSVSSLPIPTASDLLRLSNPAVHRLPPELLGDIFTLACPPLTFPFPNKNPTQMFQTTVSSICSYWRDTSHLTPRLWTSVLIRKSSHNRDILFDEMLESVLSRSGALELDLVIIYPCRGSGRLTERCAGLISDAMPRVMSLRARLDGNRYNTQPVRIFPLKNAPKLRYVNVSGTMRRGKSVQIFDENSTRDLGLLETLVTSKPISEHDMGHIPTSHLRSLTAPNIRYRAVQPFLDGCEKLEHLRLTHEASAFGTPWFIWPSSLRTVELEATLSPPTLTLAFLPPTLEHVHISARSHGLLVPRVRATIKSSILDALRSMSVIPLDQQFHYSTFYYESLGDTIHRAPNLETLEMPISVSRVLLKLLANIYLPTATKSSESPFTASTHSPLSEGTSESKPETLRKPLSLIRVFHLPNEVSSKMGIASWKPILKPLLWRMPPVAKRIEWWVRSEEDAEYVYEELGTVLSRECVRVMRVDPENPAKGMRPWPKLCEMSYERVDGKN